MIFEGMGKQKVEEVECGEICALVGIEGFEIGDTIADFETGGSRSHCNRRADHEYAIYHQRLSLLRKRR